MNIKKILLLIFGFISISFADSNINNKIKNIDIKLSNIKKDINYLLNYKFNINLNDIPFNFNIYKYKTEKINNENNKIKINLNNQKDDNNFIIKIIPKILLNKNVLIKYIKINMNGNKYEHSYWIKPGDKFENCKFISLINTKMKFKCNKKIINVEFLPKIKFN